MNAFKPPNLVPLDGSSILQENGGMPGFGDQQTPPSLSSYLKETNTPFERQSDEISYGYFNMFVRFGLATIQ